MVHPRLKPRSLPVDLTYTIAVNGVEHAAGKMTIFGLTTACGLSIEPVPLNAWGSKRLPDCAACIQALIKLGKG